MVKWILPATLVLASSCKIEAIAIPRADPMLVVHSVLNPAERNQFVLVEESLTGRQSVVTEGPYDPENPIATGNGVPVRDAIVIITDPDGIAMQGAEIRTETGGTTGIYVVRLDTYTPGTPLKMGRRYELRVEANGLVATASTLVPRATLPVGVPVMAFNRDQQTLNLPISDVELARAYWVRIDAPVSPYTIFTVDREVAVSGNSRNFFTEDLIRVFFPGFLQTVTVAAVDSNLYDYYRSGNDPFSGAGLISRISGGLGVFGSAVTIEKRQLDVTQDPSGDPIEATYTLRSGGDFQLPHTLSLYLEADGPTAESKDRLSGSYLKGVAHSPVRGALYGTRDGSAVELQVLESQSTSRIHSVFKATVRGDTLRGTFGSGKPGVFVKKGR